MCTSAMVSSGMCSTPPPSAADHLLNCNTGDTTNHKEHPHPDGNIAYHKIVPTNLQFALNLYNHISSRSRTSSKNIFLSPVSISTAFSMLSLGAKSSTRSQILEGLGFNCTEIQEEELHEAYEYLLQTLNEEKGDLQVNVGNAVFMDDELKPLKKFLDKIKHHYHAEVISSNFDNLDEAKNQINDYVENHTKGKIIDLMNSLSPDTVMVLINYIFFNATWENPFNTDFTRVSSFSVDEDTIVEIPMMYQITRYRSIFDTELSCIVLELPYRGNASMLLILPDEGKMKQVEDALTRETIMRWKDSARERYIELYFPKFSISPSLDLKEVLMDLGITLVFSDNADLSGITGTSSLKVSKAVHKAVLDVNEHGTVAAASTSIQIVPVSLHPTVSFNRPFIILIMYDKNVLFIGKVVNPTEK